MRYCASSGVAVTTFCIAPPKQVSIAVSYLASVLTRFATTPFILFATSGLLFPLFSKCLTETGKPYARERAFIRFESGYLGIEFEYTRIYIRYVNIRRRDIVFLVLDIVFGVGDKFFRLRKFGLLDGVLHRKFGEFAGKRIEPFVGFLLPCLYNALFGRKRADVLFEIRKRFHAFQNSVLSVTRVLFTLGNRRDNPREFGTDFAAHSRTLSFFAEISSASSLRRFSASVTA